MPCPAPSGPWCWEHPARIRGLAPTASMRRLCQVCVDAVAGTPVLLVDWPCALLPFALWMGRPPTRCMIGSDACGRCNLLIGLPVGTGDLPWARSRPDAAYAASRRVAPVCPALAVSCVLSSGCLRGGQGDPGEEPERPAGGCTARGGADALPVLCLVSFSSIRPVPFKAVNSGGLGAEPPKRTQAAASAAPPPSATWSSAPSPVSAAPPGKGS